MKRILSALLVISIILSLFGIHTYAALDKNMVVTTEYFFISSIYQCKTVVESDDENDKYKLTMVLDTIDESPITIYLKDKNFTFDNMNNPTTLILFQDLWDAIAQNLYEVYFCVYSEVMPGRTVEGISRELRLHEWMMRNSIVVNSFFFDIQDVLDSSTVTDLGYNDFSEECDRNAFVFEQAQTDVQVILLYMSKIMDSNIAKIANICYKFIDIRVWKVVDSLLMKV